MQTKQYTTSPGFLLTCLCMSLRSAGLGAFLLTTLGLPAEPLLCAGFSRSEGFIRSARLLPETPFLAAALRGDLKIQKGDKERNKGKKRRNIKRKERKPCHKHSLGGGLAWQP